MENRIECDVEWYPLRRYLQAYLKAWREQGGQADDFRMALTFMIPRLLRDISPGKVAWLLREPCDFPKEPDFEQLEVRARCCQSQAAHWPWRWSPAMFREAFMPVLEWWVGGLHRIDAFGPTLQHLALCVCLEESSPASGLADERCRAA